MPVHPNFKGKKGRSGRKSIRVEFDKNKTILNAWQEVDTNMAHADAVAIVLKDMTVKADITSKGEKITGIPEQLQEEFAKLEDNLLKSIIK